MLSTKERKTLETYKNIAKSAIRTTEYNTNWVPDFWKLEFDKFKNLLPNGKVIDIGCGEGRDAKFFINNNYSYVGIDLSPEMLELARKLNPTADLFEMSMYNLNFTENIFDGFWAAASYLHIPKQRADEALQELKKVVKIGGIGFFTMKEGKGEKMMTGPTDEERFFSLYSEKEFADVLIKNGFEIIEQARIQRPYYFNQPKKRTPVLLTYFVR